MTVGYKELGRFSRGVTVPGRCGLWLLGVVTAVPQEVAEVSQQEKLEAGMGQVGVRGQEEQAGLGPSEFTQRRGVVGGWGVFAV